jgi:hypothetical protein
MYPKPLPAGCRYDEANYAKTEKTWRTTDAERTLVLEWMTSEIDKMWKRAWDNTYTLGKLQYVEVPI